jgi:hypothetical protein
MARDYFSYMPKIEASNPTLVIEIADLTLAMPEIEAAL